MAQHKHPAAYPIRHLHGISRNPHHCRRGQISASRNPEIGREVAIPHHLQEDEEFSLPPEKATRLRQESLHGQLDRRRSSRPSTRADLTAVSMFQAAIAVPGRVIPNYPEIEHAVLNGEQLFEKIGSSGCHVSKLKLDKQGWIYSEPSPYNPATNLRPGTTRTVSMDLNSPELPLPRLAPDPANPDAL